LFTRTREPFRAVNALKELAFSKGIPFGVWNVRDGWLIQKHTDAENHTAKPDKTVDPYKGLKRIMDVDGDGSSAWEKGIYVMTAYHHWLGKHPGITECIRHYVRDFSETPYLRLVFLSPETEVLTEELQHDIPSVDYDLPDRDEVEAIYHYVIESSTPDGMEVPKMHSKQEIEILVSSASGMTEMEIQVAFSKAIVENKPSKESKKDWFDIPFAEFNATVLSAKTEVVKQSEVLELMSPAPLSEIGGLEAFKDWIKVIASCNTPEAIADGVDKAKGAVVVGPPGTGKTLIGKATGTVMSRPLVRVDISRCFAGIVGQSEGKARGAIKQLEAMAPCVAIIDEVDKALGGAHKGGGDSGVQQRVLGIFLTAMQESKADIFWVLTANRVGGLPSEMLRPGRTDGVWAVLPPNKTERMAVFRIHLKKRKVNPDKVKGLDLAVEASKGYVSAEIEGAVKEAKKIAFMRGTPLTGEDLVDQLRIMKPLAEAFPEDFAEMEQWASNNARNASIPDEEEPVNSDPDKISVKAARSRRRAVN
jgi:AAA+ superfamily predicted ATPase